MLLDQIPAGASDARVADLVRAEGRALITLDLDFADIRAYAPEEHSGIIVLRPRRSDATTILALVDRMLSTIDDTELVGRLWIVEPDRIRVRGLPA